MAPKAPTPRPTHFLCLPLNQTSRSNTRLSNFGRALLSSSPAIPGLDESVVIKPERLHLTLGVITLNMPSKRTRHDPSPPNPPETQARTAEDALAALRSLSRPILQRIGTSPLSIDFTRVDVMKPYRGTAQVGEAHVLWAGPPKPSSGDTRNQKLHDICQFIHSTFKELGYIVEDRPLQLHCTIVNTVYRKRNAKNSASDVQVAEGSQVQSQKAERTPPKCASRGRKREERVPFSYTAIRSSQAIKALDLATVTSLATKGQEPVQETPTKEVVTRSVGEIVVDFGNYPILSLELCEMGSYDETGGYKSVGGISLLPPLDGLSRG